MGGEGRGGEGGVGRRMEGVGWVGKGGGKDGREEGRDGREGGREGAHGRVSPPPRTQFLSTSLVSAYSIWPKTRPVAGRGVQGSTPRTTDTNRLNPMSFVWGEGSVGRQRHNDLITENTGFYKQGRLTSVGCWL
jgi:hypothetical protein